MRLPRLPRLGRRRTAPPPGALGDPPTGEQATAGHGLEGVRAWLAQLDRRLRSRSYAGAAIAALALAAAAVALVLVLETRDDAITSGDLNEVRTKITEVEQSALRAAADDVAAFGRQIEELESEVRSQRSATGRNRSEIRVANDDIEDLRQELSDLASRIQDLEAAVDETSGNDGSGT